MAGDGNDMNKHRMNKHLISLMAFDENKGLQVESMLRVGFVPKTNMKADPATYQVKIPDGLAPEKHADTQALLLVRRFHLSKTGDFICQDSYVSALKEKQTSSTERAALAGEVVHRYVPLADCNPKNRSSTCVNIIYICIDIQYI